MVDVGPVLQKGEVADAIIAAILTLNEGVRVIDRGSYWRVCTRGRCIVTQSAVTTALGAAFALPADLEMCMPAFSGRFRVNSEQAVWEGEP